MNYGLMGQKLHLMEKLAFQAFDDAMETKRPKKTFYTWQAHCEFSQTVFHNEYYIERFLIQFFLLFPSLFGKFTMKKYLENFYPLNTDMALFFS